MTFHSPGGATTSASVHSAGSGGSYVPAEVEMAPTVVDATRRKSVVNINLDDRDGGI
jgi:hypothetical protein